MKKLLRILVIVILVKVVVVVIAAAALWGIGYSRMSARPTPLRAWTATTDSARVERGRHIAELICSGCHGENTLPLAGGKGNFGQIPDGPYLGQVYAPNLTSGGELADYDDAQLARAIREGFNHDGRVMLVMPSPQFHALSDDDLSAIVAYMRSQPAIPAADPPRSLNALGHILLGAGIFETSAQPAITGPVASAVQDSTVEYGDYLVRLLACRDCHGKDLRGAPKSSLAPHGPDIVGLVAAHPASRFSLAVRRGVGLDGRPLNPVLMPWNIYTHLTDLETAAVYRYLRSLGAGGS